MRVGEFDVVSRLHQRVIGIDTVVVRRFQVVHEVTAGPKATAPHIDKPMIRLQAPADQVVELSLSVRIPHPTDKGPMFPGRDLLGRELLPRVVGLHSGLFDSVLNLHLGTSTLGGGWVRRDLRLLTRPDPIVPYRDVTRGTGSVMSAIGHEMATERDRVVPVPRTARPGSTPYHCADDWMVQEHWWFKAHGTTRR